MAMNREQLDELSGRILNAAFAVHTELGPGMLEAAYSACLAFELDARGMKVRSQVACPVIYRGVKLIDIGYRIDLLVENEIIIELKSVDAIAPVHRAQLISYLRLYDRRVGLLLNFNVLSLRDGITRMVNGY